MDKVRINIVTVCSRPQNLDIVKKSIFSNIPDKLDVFWYVVFDVKIVDDNIIKLFSNSVDEHVVIIKDDNVLIGAGEARNKAFSMIVKGFIHVIDDDNVLHPNLYQLIQAYLTTNDTEIVLVGHQILKDQVLRLRGIPSEMRLNYVDSASIVWHNKIGKDILWGNAYNCDGMFIEELFKRHSSKFVFSNQVISYYNYLR